MKIGEVLQVLASARGGAHTSSMYRAFDTFTASEITGLMAVFILLISAHSHLAFRSIPLTVKSQPYWNLTHHSSRNELLNEKSSQQRVTSGQTHLTDLTKTAPRTALSSSCSMTVLGSMLLKSTDPPPGGLSYLPVIPFRECKENSRVIEDVHRTILRINQTGYGKTFEWQHRRATLGKYITAAVAELDTFAKTIGDDVPPMPAFVNPAEDHWSRHLSCSSNSSAWTCMFGEHKNDTRELGLDDNISQGELIWRRRGCLVVGTCGAELSSTYLSILLRGWMLHSMMPLNSYELGYRSADASVKVVSIRNILPAPEERVFVSIHIRMGDSCDRIESTPRKEPWHWEEGRGRPCIAPPAYVKPLKLVAAQYNVTDILLASDSIDAVFWAKSLIDFDLHYVDFDRRKISDTRSGWIENRDDIGHTEVESSIRALQLLSNGHIFIGCMGSHFSRAIYTLMVGRRNIVIPWVSVDGHSMG